MLYSGIYCGVIPELTVKKNGKENTTVAKEDNFDTSLEGVEGDSYDQKVRISLSLSHTCTKSVGELLRSVPTACRKLVAADQRHNR